MGEAAEATGQPAAGWLDVVRRSSTGPVASEREGNGGERRRDRVGPRGRAGGAGGDDWKLCAPGATVGEESAGRACPPQPMEAALRPTAVQVSVTTSTVTSQRCASLVTARDAQGPRGQLLVAGKPGPFIGVMAWLADIKQACLAESSGLPLKADWGGDPDRRTEVGANERLTQRHNQAGAQPQRQPCRNSCNL